MKTAIGGDASFFSPDDGSISILSDDRWDWDVIHHEYAHYIAHLDGMDESPGGDHSFGVSNIPTVGKLDGVRLGWSEGLATYLGTAIQQIASSLGTLPSFPNVGDTAYTDTLDASFTIDLETNEGSENAGEGDEASVLRILWDIADDVQDTFSNGLKDVISLGHQGLYNILNNEIADLDRLDDVWDYFFNTSNDETRTQYGAIFEEYSVSPSPVSSTDLIGQTFNSGGAIPTFEWNAGNNNANDEFQIIVFNEDFSTRELVVNDINDVTQWTPTQNQWNQILDTPGEYHFVIGGSDTNGFATGSYWSGAYNFFVGQAGPTPTPTPTPENDILMGIPGDDSISALAGDDIVEGLGGNDRLEGNAGNDRLLGGAGNDTLHGGFGEDTLEGGDENDVLYGNRDNDVLNGNAGDDILRGNDGNDRLIGENGNDTLRGNFGEDTLEGGDGNDVLYGNNHIGSFHAENDVLNGNGGNDRLYGNGGNDRLIGENGNDTLYGNTENDILNGGDGDDIIRGGRNNDLLLGDAGRDTLNGSFGEDTLEGGDDDDILRGGRQNDLLIGDAGDDRLAGQRDDDTLLGGEGNDWLRGGQGNDSISGGSGRDTFVFAPNHGTDTIADFTVGEDFISLKEGLTIADVSVTTVDGDTQITLGNGTLAILPDQILSRSDIEFV